ncbi:SocA family protein [Skermanella mucosa]|uniref:hypothetical protein n=1 Tax=Skermanella mucosa TaxID=1789672 RepID=UPI00192B65B5|nr:hypothetical protein [Skermanella mucosa]UEM20080.1 SocA family protein [Skermanella mucosa]
MTTLTREELVLATLASQPAAWYQPIHVQKLFFLIDQNCADMIGGRKFDFRPYNFGPFDRTVYDTLDGLSLQGCVITRGQIGVDYREYHLTEDGAARGRMAQGRLPGPVRDYIDRLVPWALSSSFDQIVEAVYEKYPDMRANSIYRSRI